MCSSPCAATGIARAGSPAPGSVLILFSCACGDREGVRCLAPRSDGSVKSTRSPLARASRRRSAAACSAVRCETSRIPSRFSCDSLVQVQRRGSLVHVQRRPDMPRIALAERRVRCCVRREFKFSFQTRYSFEQSDSTKEEHEPRHNDTRVKARDTLQHYDAERGAQPVPGFPVWGPVCGLECAGRVQHRTNSAERSEGQAEGEERHQLVGSRNADEVRKISFVRRLREATSDLTSSQEPARQREAPTSSAAAPRGEKQKKKRKKEAAAAAGGAGTATARGAVRTARAANDDTQRVSAAAQAAQAAAFQRVSAAAQAAQAAALERKKFYAAACKTIEVAQAISRAAEKAAKEIVEVSKAFDSEHVFSASRPYGFDDKDFTHDARCQVAKAASEVTKTVEALHAASKAALMAAKAAAEATKKAPRF